MKDILKYSILAGLWAILIIPFFVANGMFFPYITGKNFAFRIIIEIIFALYLILAINYKEYRPRFSWILISVSVFAFIMLIADIFAVAPVKALWSNFERMDGFVTLIHLWAYLVVFGNVMKSEANWLWFFRSSVVLSVFMALKTLFGSEAQALTRISGPLGNPIYLGVYFMFNVFFILILLYKDVIQKNVIGSWKVVKYWLKDWKFYAYALVAFLNLWGIWKTQTRGVLLGLIGGIIITLIITSLWEKKESVLKKVSIIKIIAIIAIIIAFFAVKDTNLMKSNPTLARISSISWTNLSGQARQYVWPMALKGFVEKPIIGWGQDGFNYVFNKYYDPRMYGQESWFDRAHNMPLDMLVAGGILGLLSYLAIFVAGLYVLWKSKREIFEKAVIVGLLAAYFFQNLFVFDNLVSYFLFFVVLSYLYYIETSERENLIEKDKIDGYVMSEDLKKILAIIIVCILGFTLWYVNVRPIKANALLIKAITAQEYSVKEKKYVALTAEKTMDYFKEALSYNTFANPEIREQLLFTSQKVGYTSGVGDETKIAYLNYAFGEMENQIKSTPEDARYQIFTGSFLNNIGRSDLALPFLEKAKELSPNKQTIAFDLIQAYINMGERQKARDEAKRIYELDKSFEKPKTLYAATLILTGDEKGALELLGGKNADESITRAYVVIAVDYYKKSLLSKAVAEINKAINMNPSFEIEGKKLIDQIWSRTLKYE